MYTLVHKSLLGTIFGVISLLFIFLFIIMKFKHLYYHVKMDVSAEIHIAEWKWELFDS